MLAESGLSGVTSAAELAIPRLCAQVLNPRAPFMQIANQ